jgi:glycosyltransferase involved in cell wall biosynthesis
MKILLANYRYFVSGGPERYMFNVSEALSRSGHEIIPFSINYSRNRTTPYASYFVEPLGHRNEVTYREQKFSPRTFLRTVKRLFFDPEVERAVQRLARDTKPDIAYVLHYLRKLSPALLTGLKKAGLPVVVRLSDYAMLCPGTHCLRQLEPCELCVKGRLWPSIRYHCVQKGLAASLINGLSTWYHRCQGYFDLIDFFITTNQFMHEMMIRAGFPPSRLRCIPTFVDNDAFQPEGNYSKQDYFIYLGRLAEEKGVAVLIEAMALLNQSRPDLSARLKVVGAGDSSYTSGLKKQVEDKGLQEVVEFVGEVEAPEIPPLLSRALVAVVPSLWYENLPNSILESYACGTAVVSADAGSLGEYVKEGQTGYLFKRADSASLAKRLEYCLENKGEVLSMGKQAREVAVGRYSTQNHLILLDNLFKEILRGNC